MAVLNLEYNRPSIVFNFMKRLPALASLIKAILGSSVDRTNTF